MQTQEFNIELRNEKIKTYRLITLLVVILNTLFFISSLFERAQSKSALISLVFIAVYTVFRFYKCKKENLSFYFDEWIYFLLMLLWVNNYLLAIICLLLFLSYTISLQKIIFTFNAIDIKQKNFPWKRYQWHELSNVLIKDSLLTLDFKSNKLLQAEITDNNINEAAFNAFAKDLLSK